MARRLLLLLLILSTIATVLTAQTLDEMRAGEDIVMPYDARQIAMGGTGVASGNGPFATQANPAAAQERHDFQFGYTRGFGLDDYREDGGYRALGCAVEFKSWRLGMVYRSEDFAYIEDMVHPPEPDRERDQPRRSDIDVAGSLDITSLFRADPDRWFIRAGGSVRILGVTDVDSQDHVETDGVLGFLMQRHLHGDGAMRHGWRAAVAVTNVVNACTSGSAARRSELTLALSGHLAYKGLTSSLTYELCEPIDRSGSPAHRLGAEIRPFPWFELYGGWREDPVQYASGFSYGLGIDFFPNNPNYVRIQLGSGRFQSGEAIDDTSYIVSLATSFPSALGGY